MHVEPAAGLRAGDPGRAGEPLVAHVQIRPERPLAGRARRHRLRAVPVDGPGDVEHDPGAADGRGGRRRSGAAGAQPGPGVPGAGQQGDRDREQGQADGQGGQVAARRGDPAGVEDGAGGQAEPQDERGEGDGGAGRPRRGRREAHLDVVLPRRHVEHHEAEGGVDAARVRDGAQGDGPAVQVGAPAGEEQLVDGQAHRRRRLHPGGDPPRRLVHRRRRARAVQHAHQPRLPPGLRVGVVVDAQTAVLPGTILLPVHGHRQELASRGRSGAEAVDLLAGEGARVDVVGRLRPGDVGALGDGREGEQAHGQGGAEAQPGAPGAGDADAGPAAARAMQREMGPLKRCGNCTMGRPGAACAHRS